MRENTNSISEEELKKMQQAIGELSEEELQEVVGAGGDVNPETSIKCLEWTIQITISLLTKTKDCK